MNGSNMQTFCSLLTRKARSLRWRSLTHYAGQLRPKISVNCSFRVDSFLRDCVMVPVVQWIEVLHRMHKACKILSLSLSQATWLSATWTAKPHSQRRSKLINLNASEVGSKEEFGWINCTRCMYISAPPTIRVLSQQLTCSPL